MSNSLISLGTLAAPSRAEKGQDSILMRFERYHYQKGQRGRQVNSAHDRRAPGEPGMAKTCATQMKQTQTIAPLTSERERGSVDAVHNGVGLNYGNLSEWVVVAWALFKQRFT